MLIKNGTLYLPEGCFREGSLEITGAKITDINLERREAAATETAGQEILDAEGLYVVPGLIDIHLHGCMGEDFSNGTEKALHTLAAAELSWGVTSICPTSMTLPEETLAKAYTAAAAFVASPQEATIIGINMEGPFVSNKKLGAQNAAYVQLPDFACFERLQKAARGLIKLVDLAPELPGAEAFIRRAAQQVHVSVAHTVATYTEARAAFTAGADHLTHLFNAMPDLLHREPGVIGAAADADKVMVEIIGDGVHSHPAAVRAAFKLFGFERMILISDSMEATGLPDGNYQLGGLPVTVKGNKALLTGTETIAGSVTNLMGCLRWVVKEAHIPLVQALRCATLNPAQSIGMAQEYGSLAVAKFADVLLLDKELNIIHILKHGQLVK